MYSGRKNILARKRQHHENFINAHLQVITVHFTFITARICNHSTLKTVKNFSFVASIKRSGDTGNEFGNECPKNNAYSSVFKIKITIIPLAIKLNVNIN